MFGLAGMLARSAEGDFRPLVADMLSRLSGDGAPGTAGGGRVVLGALAHRLYIAGDLIAAWDGEVYNLEELAEDFKTDPADPGAVMAALYRRKGLEGLAELNADLALALYDLKQDALLLFRDRFGVKPLFYTETPHGLLFASEMRAFLAHPEFRPQPNPDMLFDFMAAHYRYIHRDPERTYLAGVRQVPASRAVVVQGRTRTARPYWRLTLDPDAGRLNQGQAAEALRELFSDSVKRRLPDSEPGFSVSSGMDSSSAAAMGSRLLERPVDLYSVSYGFSEYDEAAGIAPVADQYGRLWRDVRLEEPDLVDEVARLVDLHEGPLCTVTWLSHHRLVQAAAEDGRRVVVSGLGGDESLAGEYEHFLYFFADLKAAGREERLAEEVAAWVRLHDHPVFRKSAAVVEDALTRLVDLSIPGRTLPDLKRYRAYMGWFDPDFVAAHDRPPEAACPFDSYLANRCYQDLYFETTPPSLAADDKNVRHFGLTTRFPFLDHRFLRLAFSLSPTVKYDRGATKAVMRRAMQGITPEANRCNLVKTGFNAPLNQWLLGRSREAILEVLTSASFARRGFLKAGAVEQLWAEHQSGRANHMMILWQLLNAELWLRRL